jgi:hypothetical protein
MNRVIVCLSKNLFYPCFIINQTQFLMKKVLLMLVAGAFISVSMISCKKCGHCDVSGVTGTKYCEKDNKTAYDLYKSSCTAGGGTWNTN